MKIAILTNFRRWDDSYSLTHVVRAQALTLAKHGHEVMVFTMEGCSYSPSLTHSLWRFRHRACLPGFTSKPYEFKKDLSEEHKQYSQELSKLFVKLLPDFDFIFTHDWIATTLNLPLAETLRFSADSLRGLPFLHWIHSTPNRSHLDWWDLRRYGRNHKIAYPNRTDADFVAHTFFGQPTDVHVIPHIVDLRISGAVDWHPDSCAIVDTLPTLMSAEFVQVYPAAAYRLHHKGLRELILTFKTLRQRSSICLLIVDSWAGEMSWEDAQKNVAQIQKIIDRNGLESHEACFTSILSDGKFPVGLPRRILQELMQCSSVFIYPTRGEAFGLPLPETALAAGALPVFNRNLPMHFEVGGGNGLYANFGSAEQQWRPKNGKEYYRMLADLIVKRAEQESSQQYRSFVRRSFNMDRVYKAFYEPVLNEGRTLWVGC